MIRESDFRDPLSESVRSRRGEAPPLSESARTDPGADSDRGREPTRTEADSDRFKFRPGGHRWRVAGPKLESTAVPKLAEETAESAGGKGGGQNRCCRDRPAGPAVDPSPRCRPSPSLSLSLSLSRARAVRVGPPRDFPPVIRVFGQIAIDLALFSRLTPGPLVSAADAARSVRVTDLESLRRRRRMGISGHAAAAAILESCRMAASFEAEAVLRPFVLRPRQFAALRARVF